MRKNDVLRRTLTFCADSFCIIAGFLLSIFFCHPEASNSENYTDFQAVVPMLLILMALVGAVMKTYRKPISENTAHSILMSVGAFVVSLAMSAGFLILIAKRQPNIGFFVNLGVYCSFFLGVYRLAFLRKTGTNRQAGAARKSHDTIKRDFSGVPIEELLGRDAVKTAGQETGSYIAGSTVLVAGGAGLVGFELCSQILQLGAKHVVILDINENKLLETVTELSLNYPKSRFTACIGSTQDRARLREIFVLYKPQTVFHAATYKHVPLLEQNPQEALKNNVMGTLYMVEMAIKYRVGRFILLSDDMVYNSTHIMGASKRVAEMLIQRADEWGDTRFSAVRFGAAVGSGGSIIQLMKRQIETGGPVYVPDRLTEKYMMTVPEAARLILEAGSLTNGGELYTLDMGTPVNLFELARSTIIKCGLRPDKDIKIELTGRQPAEKGGCESMPKENAAKTLNGRIFVLKESENPPMTFEMVFDKLCQSIDDRDYGSAFNKIGVLVPTFVLQKE
ncbi:MAG: polysaccharide biosynthesis protein [Clostridiales bacterium]|nr:polysaccharide biosynthesis protein [Clostridiales bacterium]